jgi:hypothetical protein
MSNPFTTADFIKALNQINHEAELIATTAAKLAAAYAADTDDDLDPWHPLQDQMQSLGNAWADFSRKLCGIPDQTEAEKQAELDRIDRECWEDSVCREIGAERAEAFFAELDRKEKAKKRERSK